MRKAFALFILLLPVATFAQFTPSKSQHEKLAKQKAKIVSIQLEIARLQTEIMFEVGNLDRICREVTTANHWPAEVGCNPQNLTFAAAPPQPVAQEQVRPTAPSGPALPEQKKEKP